MKKIDLKNILAQFLNVLFATVTIALFVIAVFKPGLVVEFITWMDVSVIKKIGNWNYVIALSSATIESLPVIGVLVPGMQIMLMVGGFFGRNNLVGIIMVAIIGAIIGNYVGYFLGMRYGTEFFNKYGDWFGIGKTELRILKKQIDKNGMWFIIFGKFHNFTRAFVPFIAGSMGMKKSRFWLYNIAGSIIWAITIIILGVAFAQFYKEIVDNMKYIVIVILLIAASYISIFKRNEFKQYLKDKNAEIDEKIEEQDNKKKAKKAKVQDK